VVPLRVPPLRERPEDIRELAGYFLQDFCSRNNVKPKAIDEEVFESLAQYAWPGNVRELKNVVERMAILTPAVRITAAMIPVEIRAGALPVPSNLQQVREGAERQRILQALEGSG
jgi:DNA-binding NtrC family response regulator